MGVNTISYHFVVICGVFMGHTRSIHGVFMGYTYVSGMCRVCIGKVSKGKRSEWVLRQLKGNR